MLMQPAILVTHANHGFLRIEEGVALFLEFELAGFAEVHEVAGADAKSLLSLGAGEPSIAFIIGVFCAHVSTAEFVALRGRGIQEN